jgi:hypothetical protein
MTKKWVYGDRYPGWRPLRGLTRGYPLSPFQSWGFETDIFYKARSTSNIEGTKEEHRTIGANPTCCGWSAGHSRAPHKNKTGRAMNARPAVVGSRGRLIILRRMLRGWSVLARRPAFALPTLGALRAQLVGRELAIAIFIERLQRGGGVRDFGCVDDTVMIGV